jgi:nucleotide-binding universal stress UspA family protein
MKTILIPTDFSKNADHAARYAGLLANILNANVVLLNVYMGPSVSEFQQPYDTQTFIFQAHKMAEIQLEKFKSEFLKVSLLHHNSVTIRLVYGFVMEKIVEVAQEIEADIIVMGTKGANNMLDKWIGTVSEKVMKHAKCSVLVVPEATPIKRPKVILYAADYKNNEVEATKQIVDFGKSINADCKVVHIHTDDELNIGHKIEKTTKKLKTEFSDTDIIVKNLNRDDVIEGLETYIANNAPDLIALAFENKSVFERILNKSVTNHFVHTAKLPILIFHK